MATVSSKSCTFEENPLSGIVEYFRKTTGKSNPVDAGLISLDASGSKDTAHYVLSDVGDSSSGEWNTDDNEGWIEFNFLRNRFAITGYTLHCYPWEYLREWKVFTSINKKDWKEIDNRTLSAPPEGGGRVSKYYQVSNPFFVKYIRIKRIGTRFSDMYQYSFILHRVEFFGVFHSWKDLRQLSCVRKYRNFGITKFIVTLLLSI